MEAIVHKNINILEEIYPTWEQLKSEFHDATFFQDLSWVKSWWESVNQNDIITPYIVEVKDQDETISIFPLFLSNKEFAGYYFRILKPMGAYLSDYLTPVLSINYSIESQIDKMLEKIFEDQLTWDCIDWDGVPEDSKFDNYLKGKFEKKDERIERKRTDICPYLPLDKDVEKTKSKFSKKFLKGILYYKRKLKREGELSYTRVKQENEIVPVMNHLFTLHRERWGKTETPSHFECAKERERVLKVAHDLFQLNLLHLSYLSHDDEIAAVEFGMAHDTKRYLYIGAINLKFHKYPIGHILLYNLILEACEKGYEIMDFLKGDEPYKKRSGAIDKYNIRYKMFNKTFKSSLYQKINSTYYSEQFYNLPRGKQRVMKSFIRLSVLFLKIPRIKERSLL